MKKRTGLTLLSVYHFVYFIYLGIAAFTSKYFAEIGLNESQIGILTSVPALISMCFMPMWGALGDRMKYKKVLLAIVVAAAGVLLLFVDGMTDFTKLDAAGKVAAEATRFMPLLALLTINNIFSQACMPTSTSISLEYAASVGSSFGPIRMMGTVGYQAGVLLVGVICASTLRYMYTWQGVFMIASSIFALMLPNVGGHQYGRQKVSPLAVLKDKRVFTLLIMILVACTTTMFYMSFFGAFMEQMNISNQVASVITWVSVLLEIPLLFFSQKIMKLRSVWQWMMIGLVLTGIRWIGFWISAQAGSWALLVIFQIPAVLVLATFEFFPSIYIGEIIAPELSSSAQTMLNLVMFGVARFTGSLIGGFISQKISMETMFLINGIILLIAAAVFAPVCRKRHNEDKELKAA
ncbi:MAG: MFS transporter [Clostridia bacterium]|nr:MFS transporter [Clostridia bacterium]